MRSGGRLRVTKSDIIAPMGGDAQGMLCEYRSGSCLVARGYYNIKAFTDTMLNHWRHWQLCANNIARAECRNDAVEYRSYARHSENSNVREAKNIHRM